MENLANSKWIAKISEFGNKVGSNKYVSVISSGMMMMMPIVFIGSFASLFVGLQIPVWQSFLASTKLNIILKLIVNATTNMLGVYFTYGIAHAFSETEQLKARVVPIFAVVSYVALLPYAVLKSGNAYLAFDYLGTQGILVGMLIAIFSVKIYGWVERKDWMIKMPAGTPDYVAQSFASIIPGAILIGVVLVVNVIIGFTPYSSIFELLYSILQVPLTAFVGASLLPNLLFILLTQLSWSVGVHPGYLSSLLGPILISLNVENQAAFAVGKQLPNIINLSFSYISTIATFYPAIAVSILIFSKSGRLKDLGKIALAPAVFGISEPLIFGLPIMFNPIIWIPWIITPLVNFSIGYFLTAIGLVAKTSGAMIFNMPMIATGLLNGHVSIAIMEVVLFVLDIIIFAPFIIIMDRKYRLEEKQK